MSLRAEICEALDDVIPAAPMLEHTVTTFVLGDERDRKALKLRTRRSRWIKRLRAPIAVVAALLVLALIVGLIVGGRMLRDLHSSPAPAVNQSELRKLEARPLVAMPPMPSSGECPVGPMGSDFANGSGVGTGLMRSFGGAPAAYSSAWGKWNLSYFVVNPTARGLFLVRARDLQSGKPAFFSGNLSGIQDPGMGRAVLAGDVAGRDVVNGVVVQLHPELVVNASAPSDSATNPQIAPLWTAYVGYPTGASGCVFFQVDHDDSTETYVFGY
jgi:hypothetical protein